MAAYIWAEITVHDGSKMKNYLAKVGDTIKKYEGKPLALAGATEVLEGGIGQHPAKYIIEFPSAEKAKAWYHSPEYQDIVGERLDNATANMMVIEGVQAR